MANMANFGTKEPWMEPMNAFLSQHRDSFKRFIEDICFVPHPPALLIDTTPAYSTPNAIKTRLPLTSRQGFPSLPFLIDDARELAGLVDLWLHASSAGRAASNEPDGSGPLHRFHDRCTDLHARTQECLARAERAERPTSNLSFRWEELIESLQTSASLDTNLPLLAAEAAAASASVMAADAQSAENEPPTPIAQTMQAKRESGDQNPFSFSPGSPPGRAQQREWEAPLPAEASFDQRSHRAGFVLPSSSSSAGPSASNTTGVRGPVSHPDIGVAAGLDFIAAHRGADVLRFEGAQSQQQQHLTDPALSRPASALSGRFSLRSGHGSAASDNDAETALPSVSRERARRERAAREERERNREIREREREREKEKERERQMRLKDIVGGFGIGKRGKRDRDRERERERG